MVRLKLKDDYITKSEYVFVLFCNHRITTALGSERPLKVQANGEHGSHPTGGTFLTERFGRNEFLFPFAAI